MNPRLFCNAVTVVVGRGGKKQEQVQLQKVTGESRLMIPGPSLLLLTDREEDFGRFEPGMFYECQFNIAPIAKEEADALLAREEAGSREPFEEVMREAAGVFRKINEQLANRAGAPAPVVAEQASAPIAPLSHPPAEVATVAQVEQPEPPAEPEEEPTTPGEVAVSGTTVVRHLSADELRERGFEDLDEFHRLCASVPLDREGALDSFREWQTSEGTKDALLARFPVLREVDERQVAGVM